MNAFILPLMIGAPQIILIVVIILLLFGGRKIPELMRGLGSGIKEFKDASKDEENGTTPEDGKKVPEENK
ncbi:twin-arginine translocase TatA/TatE family subunit [Christiangramia forsetii]|uniref:Sec-independent protein translocase protein TatA n=2 Tax=Christiangramia forsetii TaxID=411153 RepID=A0M6I9_CHRFK|nr:twin-arginine translocase TatA/TatE family subunit [Christiangramia forsetii]GGG30292.1 Sec-independent protein translocase protein TatA [Christiangramia forsetii]CAL68234.1 Sec-independent protein translocase protein TatA [Christiangramia forsetii KT0803]